MSISLVLLRHFPSYWNDPKARRFTGLIDIGLARGSYEQGIKMGALLTKQGYSFDACYTSKLKRAYYSLEAVLRGMNHGPVLVERDARLNERRYGYLEGMTHDSAREKFGADKVHGWRRSYVDQPPEGESLEDKLRDVLSFWAFNLEPLLARGKRVMVVSHANTLRALMMYLAGMTPDEVEKYEIPTGTAILCDIDTGHLNECKLLKYQYLSA